MKAIFMNPQKAITQAYIILLMTAFLFFTGAKGYADITLSKFLAFSLLSCTYVVSMAVASIAAARVCRPLSAVALLKKLSWPQRAALLYLSVTWISAFASPYWPETVLGASRYEGAFTITLYVLCFLLVAAYGEADRLLLWALVAAVTLESLLCIVQLAGKNPFGLYPKGYSYFDAGKAYGGEYLGTLGNTDLMAAFYCLAVPILSYGMACMKGVRRLALLAAFALSSYTLVRISVMAGFVGVAAGLLLALPMGFREKRTRLICAAALAGLLLAALLAVYIADPPVGMPHEIHNILHGDFDSSFGSGRIHIWKEAAAAAVTRPLLGFGPDTMINGGVEPFTRYDAELGIKIVAMIDTAHNEYLNIWYHQGILALGAYIWLLVLLAKRWTAAAPADGAALALGAGIIGYCAQAFFGFSMCITAPFFWTALGLLARRIDPAKGKE